MAADSVGSVSMQLRIDKNDFKSHLKSVVGEAVADVKKDVARQANAMSREVVAAQKQVTEATRETTTQLTKQSKAMNSIAGIAKKAIAAFGIGISIAGLLAFGKSCVDLGSDLAEVQNVVDVVYSSMSDDVNEFTRSALKSYGMSETVAKKYMGTLGAMSKAFGYSEQEAYAQASSLTSLAGDMASFYNKTTDETFTALKAVYSGETEVLKQYGVVMTETALNEFSLAKGIGKTVSQMTEQEKVSLRLAFVQDKLSDSAGDFARTSGSWANQTRVLALSFESFKASIGQGLINLLSPVVQWLNSIMDAANGAAQAFANFTATLTGKKQEMFSGLATSTASAAESAQQINKGISSAGGAAKKAVKQLAGFDKLNILSKQQSSGGGGGSSASASAPIQSEAAPTISDAAKKSLEGYANVIRGIKQAADPTVESIKRLWNEGLSQLGGFTWQGLKDFWNNFLLPLGKWTLGEGLPRFIDVINNGLTSINWGNLNSSLANFWTALEPLAEEIGSGVIDFWEHYMIPISTWTMGEGLPEFIDITTDGLSSIDLDDARDSLNDFWDALSSFQTDVVGEGLLWIYDNVLVPLGTWTINEVVPRFFTTLAIVFTLVNSVLSAIQPVWQWFWDNLLKPIATWTGGMFLNIWDKINGALSTFSNWAKKHKKTIENVTKAVIAFCAAWVIIKISAFITFCGGLTGALITLGAQLAASTGITTLWTTVTTAASGAATTFGAAMTFLTGPIGMVLLAITAVVTAVVVLVKNWDKIKEGAAAIWDKTKEIFRKAKEAIQKMFENIGGWFAARWNDIKNAFAEVINWFSGIFNSARDKVHEAFNAIGSWFRDRWNEIANVFTNVASWFYGKFNAAVKKIHDAFNEIGSWFSDRWNDITGIFEGVGDWFSEKFTGAVNKIHDAFASIGTWAAERWSDITGVFGSVASWFGGIFSDAWSEITDVFSGVAEFFGGIWDTIKEKFTALGTTVGNAMGDAVKTGINTVLSLVEDAINGGIDLINKAIRLANKLPGVNVSTIDNVELPRLAQGGFVKANTPQLAMIGDNRHEGEIVAPESKINEAVAAGITAAMPKMMQMMVQALSRLSLNGGTETVHVVCELDGQTVYETVEEYKRQKNGRSGGRM